MSGQTQAHVNPPGWDVERGARLYRQGWTLRQLAAEFGVRDSTTIRRKLIKVGVEMRPARLPKGGPPTADLVRLRETGLTYAQIATEVDMTQAGVHARFRREGLLHGR